MILIIDNYDSFTYNLVQYLGELGVEMEVARNDAITIDEIKQMKPDAIVISPGPCTPYEAGISIDVIKQFHKSTPILGVCLGHQAIGVAFGGKVIKAPTVMHGKVSEVYHNNSSIFSGLPNPFKATRYHSLIVDKPPASFAPRFAASIIPGPPPVIIPNPDFTSSFATSRAIS
ncbi:anthranilate synthase component 2 [Candidatus Kryptonium thompsonii]|uniref:anthranilate synthase component II n=1 Tax=Candidatus Kryptonium thompsonii TaxID=1633631 RepID=UPI000707BB3F|nr:aminodeoxychorismate/anthranilate synthase component II [Candidatus Kryptonium thompsoni]CUS95481.1 anthranilate synthase component 2 [Candidatus Kryptonium thompsoni]